MLKGTGHHLENRKKRELLTVAHPAKLPKAQSSVLITCPKGVTGVMTAGVRDTGTRKGAVCSAMRLNSS